MDETKLKRLLKSVGMRVFVQYFREFRDLDTLKMVALLRRKERSFTPKARASRTRHARRIFHDRWEEQALSVIAESRRVEPETAHEARALLKQLRSHI